MLGLNPRAQKNFNTVVASCAISGLAVVFRIWCKILRKQGLHADDYWIVIGLVFYWVSSACAVWGRITGGGGAEMEQLMILVAEDPKKLKLVENYLKSVFLAFTFLTASIFAVKLSILYFYRRIFFIAERYHYVSLAVIITCIITFIGTEIGGLLLCVPLDALWDLTKPGKCQNTNSMFLATGIVDILIDTIILALPIRIIITLQLPKGTKLAVAGLFTLGGFAVATNIIRIHSIYQPGAKFVKSAETERWATIHMVTAFMCACLPLYKPLWTCVSNATLNLIGRLSSFRPFFNAGNATQNNMSYIRMGAPGPPGDKRNPDQHDLEMAACVAPVI